MKFIFNGLLIILTMVMLGCSTTKLEPIEKETVVLNVSKEDILSLMGTNIDITSRITIRGDHYIDGDSLDGRNFYVSYNGYTNWYVLSNGVFIDMSIKKPKKIEFDPYKEAIE